VHIDTAEPSLYAYPRHTWINGREHIQLTYTYWFPRHRTLYLPNSANCASCAPVRTKLIDAEAGRIEGATLRITLDEQLQPAIFETLLNCGCYHRCYVSRSVESASCTQYGSPDTDKSYCVERIIPGKFDWIIPEIISTDGPCRRPLLFTRAGYHGLAGVCFDESAIAGHTLLNQRTYALRPYDALERLSIGSEYRSMFGPDGLVHGAGRLEGILMAPTGMLSAGQPRQRGTQLLHWDQYDFDDPRLLENCLRLPHGL